MVDWGGQPVLSTSTLSKSPLLVCVFDVASRLPIIHDGLLVLTRLPSGCHIFIHYTPDPHRSHAFVSV